MTQKLLVVLSIFMLSLFSASANENAKPMMQSPMQEKNTSSMSEEDKIMMMFEEKDDMQTANMMQDEMTMKHFMKTPKAVVKRFSVRGMGVIPMNSISKAQAVALATRAATVDAYRQLSETLFGVYVEAYDITKNMVIARSEVRTHVQGVVKQAHIVERKYSNGIAEVLMEINIRVK